MDIKEIKRDGLNRECEVFIAPESIQGSFEAAIVQQALTFKMPGFREGKVPLAIVKKKIGDKIFQEQLQKSVAEAVQAVLQKAGGEPAGRPEISVLEYSLEKGLSLVVRFEVLPEMSEINYNEISLQQYEVEVSKQDVEPLKSKLMSSLRNFQPTEPEYKSQLGDAVKIDFVGSIDGIEFPGGRGEDFLVEIGSKALVPGFEDQLMNLVAGEEVVVKVTFPELYPSHAGQKAVFNVKVHAVLRDTARLQMNDEVAQKFGAKDLAELEDNIIAQLSYHFKERCYLQMKKELFDLLDAKYQVEMPKVMIEEELQKLLEQSHKNSEDPVDTPEAQEKYRMLSHRRVKLGLLLASTAKNNKIVVAAEDFEKAIQNFIARDPSNQEQILSYYKNQDNIMALHSTILENKAVDFIISKINLVTKKLSTAEFHASDFMSKGL